MDAVRREPTWRVLLRGKWLILLIVLVVSAGTAALSKLQPPVYVATATLVVNQPAGGASSFDTVQANQAYARTLARLIDSRNVAAEVVRVERLALSPNGLLDRMSFTPVNETQLIEVSAESQDAEFAARLANAYANTFVVYVQSTIPLAAPTSGVSVADDAVVPSAPARPKPTLYTLVALVLSTAFALGLVLVRSRLDTRLHDTDALQELFGLPVLGVLPKITKAEHSDRFFEESVRLLATSIAHASEGSVRSIVVTSTQEGEGKSTVTAELAVALASLSLVDGAILAVDADLRRPTLHVRAGLPENRGSRRGLTTYLRDEASARAVTLPTELSSLRLIPAGPLPSHPSALLGFPTSRNALRQLADEAEVVVLDTPPLTVGADATLVAMDADCVLMVVDLARTRAPQLRTAIDQLSQVGKTPLGFVVNRSKLRDRSAAYAYVAPPPSTKDLVREEWEDRYERDAQASAAGGSRSSAAGAAEPEGGESPRSGTGLGSGRSLGGAADRPSTDRDRSGPTVVRADSADPRSV